MEPSGPVKESNGITLLLPNIHVSESVVSVTFYCQFVVILLLKILLYKIYNLYINK
jgi:hypothetical protein